MLRTRLGSLGLGGLGRWIEGHRWQSFAAGVLLLFVVGALGGYWAAGRLDSKDRDKLARDTIAEMNAAAGGQGTAAAAKYASIDDVPGLPRYEESDPAHPPRTVVDKPRAKPTQQLAALESGELPSWRRNAVPFRELGAKPLIAIVIDDVGLDRPRSKRAWELPGPLTLSFLPYAKDLREQARQAHAHGNELLLHMPMEPNGRADPGPNALLVSLSDRELRQRLTQALDSFDGYVGVNNHMGSRFTAFRPGMETVLHLLKARGLLFLDSRTTTETVGDKVAQELGVPSVSRNVFLDDDEALAAVRRKLAQTEEVARHQGYAVAIGHPHEATLQALAEWLPSLAAKGFAEAPLSAALRKRNGWD